MSLLSAIVAGLGLGLLLGGRFRNLGRLELRWAPLILAALLIQLVLFTGLSFPAWTVTVLYVLSTLLGVVWLLRNVAVPGIPCMAAGALSNLVAIVVNGGRMPVYASLLSETRGAAYVKAVAFGAVTTNSSLVDNHTRLVWLVDRILIPSPWPLPTVISVGDVLIGLGAVWLIAAGMQLGARATSPRANTSWPPAA